MIISSTILQTYPIKRFKMTDNMQDTELVTKGYLDQRFKENFALISDFVRSALKEFKADLLEDIREDHARQIGALGEDWSEKLSALKDLRSVYEDKFDRNDAKHEVIDDRSHLSKD